MVTIAICDDEKEMRNRLAGSVARQMELLGEPCRIKEFSDGAGLLMQLRENPWFVDIIFLDIELGKENGVEIARRIRKENEECILIFITGYSEYVFHGYEVGALNYILKPYREQKIEEVLQEALYRLDKKKERFISVMCGSSLIKLAAREIYYISSKLRKLTVRTKDREWEFYGKLTDMEEKLPSDFVRIHQSYLVNMRHVERVDKDSVLLKGQSLPVSKRCYQEAAGAFARLLIEK